MKLVSFVFEPRFWLKRFLLVKRNFASKVIVGTFFDDGVPRAITLSMVSAGGRYHGNLDEKLFSFPNMKL